MVHNLNAKGYVFSIAGFSTKGQQLFYLPKKQNDQSKYLP